MRSAGARRFRDLVNDLVLEQGRELSISEIGLVRSVAALLVRSEELQAAAVRGEHVDADELIRTASEARRLLSSLRKPATRREPEQPSLAQYLSRMSPPVAEGDAEAAGEFSAVIATTPAGRRGEAIADAAVARQTASHEASGDEVGE